MCDLFLALAERRRLPPVPSLLGLKFAGVGVDDVHGFDEKITGRIPMEGLSPSSLILSAGFRDSAIVVAAKRGADIVIAIFALIFTLPIMAIVALAIQLETGSPVFFKQERV